MAKGVVRALAAWCDLRPGHVLRAMSSNPTGGMAGLIFLTDHTLNQLFNCQNNRIIKSCIKRKKGSLCHLPVYLGAVKFGFSESIMPYCQHKTLTHSISPHLLECHICNTRHNRYLVTAVNENVVWEYLTLTMMPWPVCHHGGRTINMGIRETCRA